MKKRANHTGLICAFFLSCVILSKESFRTSDPLGLEYNLHSIGVLMAFRLHFYYFCTLHISANYIQTQICRQICISKTVDDFDCRLHTKFHMAVSRQFGTFFSGCALTPSLVQDTTAVSRIGFETAEGPILYHSSN